MYVAKKIRASLDSPRLSVTKPWPGIEADIKGFGLPSQQWQRHMTATMASQECEKLVWAEPTAKTQELWKVTLSHVSVSPTQRIGESRSSTKTKQMLLLSRLLLEGKAWCQGCYTMALECFQNEKQVHRVVGCQGSRKACAGLKESAKMPPTSLPASPSHPSADSPLQCTSPPVKGQQWWLGREGGVTGTVGRKTGAGDCASMTGPQKGPFEPIPNITPAALILPPSHSLVSTTARPSPVTGPSCALQGSGAFLGSLCKPKFPVCGSPPAPTVQPTSRDAGSSSKLIAHGRPRSPAAWAALRPPQDTHSSSKCLVHLESEVCFWLWHEHRSVGMCVFDQPPWPHGLTSTSSATCTVSLLTSPKGVWRKEALPGNSFGLFLSPCISTCVISSSFPVL